MFVFVLAGSPILISSSNSDLFAEPVRSLFDLQSVPADLREAATFAQGETGVPLHVFFRRLGVLADHRTLLAILRRVGSETLARLDLAPAYHARFTEGDLPPFAHAFACDYEPMGLFLDSYRRLAELHLPKDGLLCRHVEPDRSVAARLTTHERELLAALQTAPIPLSFLTPSERVAAYVLTRVDCASIHPLSEPPREQLSDGS